MEPARLLGCGYADKVNHVQKWVFVVVQRCTADNDSILPSAAKIGSLSLSAVQTLLTTLLSINYLTDLGALSQVPLYMVSGKPIPVPKVNKNDANFKKAVDDIHAQVVQQLQELYDKHKASYGWADRPLMIE